MITAAVKQGAQPEWATGKGLRSGNFLTDAVKQGEI